MTYREIPEDRILRFPSTAGFKGWKSFFTEESTTHPAKMNLNLLRHIITTYTEMGDVILDPMAGTGSTIILAALEGRHGIAVEYEEHFCKMIRENIKLTEKQSSFKPRGKMLCIQGDARELSKLLKESDVIVTSPPYSESLSQGEGVVIPFKVMQLHRSLDKRLSKEEIKEKVKELKREIDPGYSKDPKNIGNLPHGDVDAVIVSPPYGSDNANLRERKDKSAQSVLASTGVRAVPLEEDNIGVLEYGDVDAVVVSPPYGSSKAFHDIGFMKNIAKDLADKSKKGEIKGHHATEEARIKSFNKMDKGTINDPDNIANLEYGEVDAILTSPPYEGSLEASTRHTKGGIPERDPKLGQTGTYAKLDVVITSPPYADSVKRGDEGPSAHGEERPTYEERLADPKVYSNDPKNIGNLRHGEVDSVITSPPYEGSRAPRGRDSTREQIETRLRNAGYSEDYIQQYFTETPSDDKMKGLGTSDTYGEDSNNIGNLKSESYLEAMLQCYREFWKVLKDSGKLILVTKNFIRDKKVVRLDSDTIRLCEASGFTLKDRWYFRLPQISFWRILYQKKFPDVPKIIYEDVLIFTKGVG